MVKRLAPYLVIGFLLWVVFRLRRGNVRLFTDNVALVSENRHWRKCAVKPLIPTE